MALEGAARGRRDQAIEVGGGAVGAARGRTTRDALKRVVAGFIKSVGRSETGRVLAGLVAEMAHNPQLAKAVRAGILERRRSLVFAILERGIDRAELRPGIDIELVADMLAGAVVMRVLLTGGSVTPWLVHAAVDAILDGIAA